MTRTAQAGGNGEAAVNLHRTTKGQRSTFFDNPEIDQLMTFIMELMTEVIVLQDKHDLLERFLDERGVLTREDLLDYVPNPEAEAQRTTERLALVKRVLRIHQPEGRQEG